MITFLTGGARSGKSRLAGEMARSGGEPVRFIATAVAGDEEMTERIEKHRGERPADWTVVEEPFDLAAAIRAADSREVVLVDCVTLWISNLMVEHEDADILERVDDAVEAGASRGAPTIVISNEVGSGLVPMDPVGRRFRDLHGQANQRFARAATLAYLVVAGRLLRLEDPGIGV